MPTTFQVLAAHPALDFVNTLDNRFVDRGPTELLSSYADLLAFAEQTGVLDPRQGNMLRKKSDSPAAAKALRRARDLREILASVFYGIKEQGAPHAEALKCFERYAVAAQRHRELVWAAGGPRGAGSRAGWEWGRFEGQVELPVWALTLSAAELLASDALSRVHACASQTCRWLFLDTSKNHSRRWCDMAVCGNRMKARRFQARQQ
jgi:predicted RNA-binding Zn ribbon-like protein